MAKKGRKEGCKEDSQVNETIRRIATAEGGKS
jgi:hypothetical protein